MFKTTAINMLGGTTTAAAQAMGISYQAVKQWPPRLPSRIADRVLGVVARRRFPQLARAERGAADDVAGEASGDAADDALQAASDAGLCLPNQHGWGGEGA